jgi:hypothetical protein
LRKNRRFSRKKVDLARMNRATDPSYGPRQRTP